MLSSEIGDAMKIETLSWKRHFSGDPQGTFNDYSLYMGLCSNDELGVNFDDNYISGTRILVMSSSPYTTPSANPNEWFDNILDTPFWYNGEDNLIIEVEWSSGSGSLYSWHWDSGGQRCVIGPYGASSGSETIHNVPNLKLNGVLSLPSSTFGAIKTFFN